MKNMILASQYNYMELVEQYINADSESRHAALQELGKWFNFYSEGRFWNGECWDASEAGICIRPVAIYDENTDEMEYTGEYEEV